MDVEMTDVSIKPKEAEDYYLKMKELESELEILSI